jgi:hypothetical protein
MAVPTAEIQAACAAITAAAVGKGLVFPGGAGE